ncbi:MAG: peptidase S10 [Chloroflexota bacterium]|nr:peptidase S10 [Chloroflexota bacterium]
MTSDHDKRDGKLDSTVDGGKESDRSPEERLPDPIVRHHQVSVGGRVLSYTTTAGMLPVRDDKPDGEGTVEANLFFTAYTLDDVPDDRRRPLTFTFNGGPGSASVWLHLGGLAPKRVEMLDDGAMPRPPFSLVANEFTWLPTTDMVFIDPVDTGYSRATSDDFAKKAKDVKGDIASVGEFIRLFLTRSGRWTSPLFLAGESYGTYRSAGLAGYLIDKGIAFNGIILISSILNMQTARFATGNDLPFALFLPTYAATAWYHGKVTSKRGWRDIRAFLDEVEAWVESDYVPALSAGDRLDRATREGILDGLERYTGLDRAYLDLANLRIHIQAFCKELLRTEGRTAGRLDSRFKGQDKSGVSQYPDYDPSMSAIRPPFTSVINNYIRRELGYESDREYHILRGLDWNWGDAVEGYADTSDAMQAAFARNPYMHLFVASGYYDLATPYYATLYTVNHMALDQAAHERIRMEEYPVGHMVYLEQGALAKLERDVSAFIAKAISG